MPVAILPVLPGDTIKAASIKARILSKPLTDKLSGWWAETYLFYVRIGDWSDAEQEDFKAMILSASPMTTYGFAFPEYYMAANKVPFTRICMDHIVPTWFRDEDITDDQLYAGFGGYYVSQIAGGNTAFDSLAVAELMDGGEPADADEWVLKWEAWQAMRQEKITTASWEEYLAAQGVALPPQLVQTEANRKAELLHFTRDWQFPVQAVEPSTGVPSALVQWSLADRLKRGRFCAEPGFIVQLVLMRPKVYMKNQRASMASYLMDDRNAWMPSQMDTDPHSRLRMFDGVGTVGGAGSGPVYGAEKDYWIDPMDYLQRGDQFTNLDLGSTVAGALAGVNIVDLPAEIGSDGLLNAKFPSSTDADNLFSGSDKYVEVDGVTTFQIASRAGRGDATGRRGGMG